MNKPDIDWERMQDYLLLGMLVVVFGLFLPLVILGWIAYKLMPKDKQ